MEGFSVPGESCGGYWSPALARLNPALDLAQAEAVADLIRARTDRAAAAAVEQLEGALSRRFEELYGELLAIAANLEFTLDFPEDEPSPLEPLPLCRRLQTVCNQMRSLLATWDEGHALRDGLLVVISGKPNVGKSTLLNRLLGVDRAIVSATPGTTRDFIEENFNLHGIPIRLVDTAGLRDASGMVEQEGIRRAFEKIRKADINIHMIDASNLLTHNDMETLRDINKKTTIVVLNKTDLGLKADPTLLVGYHRICTSLLQKDGHQAVENELVNMLENSVPVSAPPHAVISERHRMLLDEALHSAKQAEETLNKGKEDELIIVASLLRHAASQVGIATGRNYSEDILESIFSRFCVGK
jgi:tRNA modification GTPase